MLRGLVERYGLVGAVTGRPGSLGRELVSVDGRRGGREPRARARRGCRRVAHPPPGVPADGRLARRGQGARAHVPLPDARRSRGARAHLEEVAERARGAGLRARFGRMVLEVIPPLDAHKGTAVRALLERAGLTRALFAGDDTTDLDAFGAVEELEVGVKVAVASDRGPAGARRPRRRRRPRPGRPRRAAADAVSNPLHGRPLAQRLRLGPVEVDRYLAERLGGLAYMRRLRAIEDEEARQVRLLDEAWHVLAEEEAMTDEGVRPRLARDRGALGFPPAQRARRAAQRVLPDRGARPDEPAHRRLREAVAPPAVRRGVDPRALGPGP